MKKLLKSIIVWFKVFWIWFHHTSKSILRFFNLLEPDVPYMALSLSKLSVWLTLALTIYVISTGKGLAEAGAALVANVGAIGNYAYRRHIQAKTGTGAYGDVEEDPMPPMPDAGDAQ